MLFFIHRCSYEVPALITFAIGSVSRYIVATATKKDKRDRQDTYLYTIHSTLVAGDTSDNDADNLLFYFSRMQCHLSCFLSPVCRELLVYITAHRMSCEHTHIHNALAPLKGCESKSIGNHFYLVTITLSVYHMLNENEIATTDFAERKTKFKPYYPPKAIDTYNPKQAK